MPLSASTSGWVSECSIASWAEEGEEHPEEGTDVISSLIFANCGKVFGKLITGKCEDISRKRSDGKIGPIKGPSHRLIPLIPLKGQSTIQ